MSKDRSEFETAELDFIENIDSFHSGKHSHEIEDESTTPFVFNLNHAFSFSALFAGYLADTFIANLTHYMNSTIADDIGQPANDFYWILTIPTLVAALLGPVAGRASDMYGRKYIQLAASVFGIIGSVIAGTAKSMRVLMVASAIFSIGYAGHQLALASIVETVPRRHRALTIGIFMGALIPAAGFSPLIGAAFTVHSSWRALFWLSLGLYTFSLIGTFLFYHPQQMIYREAESFGKSIKQFDYIGAFLMLAGITTIAVGLIFGGTVYPWISAGVFVPTFLGILVTAVLIAWVVFNRLQYPFIPRSLGLRYWLMWACIFLIGMVCSTTIGLWPQQVQILYTQEQIALGLFQTPYGVAECIFALIAGFLFFPKQARWILTGYSTILFIVSSAQAIVDKDTAVGSTTLSGFNGAMHAALIVVSTAMVQLTVNHEDLGMATNLAFSAYTFGGVAYGIIDQIIVKNHLKKEAMNLIVPALYEAGIPLADLLVAVPAFLAGQLNNPVFANASPAGLLAAGEAMKEAYVHVLHYVYLISILFGGLLVVLSIFQRSVETQITSKVDVRLWSLRGSALSKIHNV